MMLCCVWYSCVILKRRKYRTTVVQSFLHYILNVFSISVLKKKNMNTVLCLWIKVKVKLQVKWEVQWGCAIIISETSGTEPHLISSIVFIMAHWRKVYCMYREVKVDLDWGELSLLLPSRFIWEGKKKLKFCFHFGRRKWGKHLCSRATWLILSKEEGFKERL